MSSVFTGLYSLSSALEAFQTQLDVTGQNISNVNTPGYSRQRVNLTEAPSSIAQGGSVSIGTGVSVSSVTRIRQMFLQGASSSAASDLGKANAQSDASTAINSVILDPSSNGLATTLSAFWNAWSALSSNPTDSGSKLAVQQAGQSLADQIRGTYSGLQSLSQQQSAQVNDAITSAQKDLNQIATLNSQIQKATGTGASPNDLLDQRDQAVQDLSTYMNVNVQSYNGAYAISSGGVTLVDQSGARSLPTTYNAATSSLTGSLSPNITISSGQIGGLFDSINKLTSYSNSLNTMADQIRTNVNNAYSTAVTPAGTGALFFSSGSGAPNFDLDSTGLTGPPVVPGVKTSAQSIATGTSGNASDSSVAQQVANLSTQVVSGSGGLSVSDFYGQLVDQIGTDGKNATSAQSTQKAIVQQVASQIQSSSGVSLDDEMATLLQFQRSYQAAAQAVTAFNTTTQSLIAMVSGL